jgi:NADPH2:quinone reductase
MSWLSVRCRTLSPAEVRIRVAASGINPGDVKKRQDAFGYGMPYPRVIPP